MTFRPFHLPWIRWSSHASERALAGEERIFQCDVLITAQNENDKPNHYQHGIQHEQSNVPTSDARINGLLAYEILAKDRQQKKWAACKAAIVERRKRNGLPGDLARHWPRSLLEKVIISGDELDATGNRADSRGYEVARRTREADGTN